MASPGLCQCLFLPPCPRALEPPGTLGSLVLTLLSRASSAQHAANASRVSRCHPARRTQAEPLAALCSGQHPVSWGWNALGFPSLAMR